MLRGGVGCEEGVTSFLFNGVDFDTTMADFESTVIPAPPSSEASRTSSLHDSTTDTILPPIRSNPGSPRAAPVCQQEFKPFGQNMKIPRQRQRQQYRQHPVPFQSESEFPAQLREPRITLKPPGGDAFAPQGTGGSPRGIFSEQEGNGVGLYTECDTAVDDGSNVYGRPARDASEAKMPESFYSEIETFISMPPPNLKTIVTNSGKVNRRRTAVATASLNVEGLRRQRTELRHRAYVAAAPGGEASDKVTRRPRKGDNALEQDGHGGSSSSMNFDYKLLADAMTYVEEVQLSTGLLGDSSGARPGDGEGEGTKSSGLSSPKQGKASQAMRRKKKPRGGAGASRQRGFRPTRGGASAYVSSSSSSACQEVRGDGGEREGGGLDVKGMVANFEQGLELQRLRAELAASQHRMGESREVLRSAASSFYGSTKAARGRRERELLNG